MAAGTWLRFGRVPSQMLPRRQEQKAQREDSGPSLLGEALPPPPPLPAARGPGCAWGPLLNPSPGLRTAAVTFTGSSGASRSRPGSGPSRHQLAQCFITTRRLLHFWPPASFSCVSAPRPPPPRGSHGAWSLAWEQGGDTATEQQTASLGTPTPLPPPDLFLIAIPGDSYHQGIFLKQSLLWLRNHTFGRRGLFFFFFFSTSILKTLIISL